MTPRKACVKQRGRNAPITPDATIDDIIRCMTEDGRYAAAAVARLQPYGYCGSDTRFTDRRAALVASGFILVKRLRLGGNPDLFPVVPEAEAQAMALEIRRRSMAPEQPRHRPEKSMSQLLRAEHLGREKRIGVRA